MNESRIMVSVIVPVYNHENFIAQALDSILMQKVSFNIEVLVGEDCSTDNSRHVIREYDEKHPGFMKVFYREQNLGKSTAKYNNPTDLRMRSKGKYIITLEGDDFWIDPYKLQKQVDFLEGNSEYIAVAHNCVVVDKYNNKISHKYPECKDDEYTLEHFVSGIMPGQLTTVLMRNYILDKRINSELLDKGLTPGDRLIYFTLVTQGKVKCLQEKMSAYRYITTEGSSFSATFKYSFDYFVNYYNCMLAYAKRISNQKAVEYTELLYVRNLFRGLKSKQISLKQLAKMWMHTNDKAITTRLLLIELYNQFIRRKKFSEDLIL